MKHEIWYPNPKPSTLNLKPQTQDPFYVSLEKAELDVDLAYLAVTVAFSIRVTTSVTVAL